MSTNRAIDGLIDEIRARAARTNDNVLITEAFVLEWLNEGQLEVARRTPGHIDLFVSDTTTFEVDTWSSTGTAVTAATRTSRVSTLTASGHGLYVGDIATVTDVEGSTSFNGTFEILSVSGDNVTYRNNLADDTATSFGEIVKTADKPRLDLSELSVKPLFTGGLWLLNGDSTEREGIRYLPKFKFDKRYLPVNTTGQGHPQRYTREGDVLIFDAPVSDSYMGLPYRIDYSKYPTTLTNAAVTCDMRDTNKGLILYGLKAVYQALSFARPQFIKEYERADFLFNDWLDSYVEQVELQTEWLFDD